MSFILFGVASSIAVRIGLVLMLPGFNGITLNRGGGAAELTLGLDRCAYTAAAVA
jgi:hypothetical protein